LKTKILIIGVGKQPAPEDQIYSGEFKTLVAKGSFEILPDSIHMTFLQPCKPGVEQEDPELAVLCAENEKKVQMQKKVSERILGFLN